MQRDGPFQERRPITRSRSVHAAFGEAVHLCFREAQTFKRFGAMDFYFYMRKFSSCRSDEQQSGIRLATIHFLETANCKTKLGNMPWKLNCFLLSSWSSESYFTK